MTTTSDQRNQELALAIRHHMEGRYDEAERIYLSLHQKNKQDEEVLYLLGVLCCDLGIYASACRFIDAALQISPQFPEALQQLGAALLGQARLDLDADQLDQAEAGLTRALNLFPNDAQVLLALGRLALQRGDSASAETLLTRALQQLGDQADGLNWLGLACLRQKKFVNAEQALRRVLALQPELNQARNNLGLALYEQGKLEAARACFADALERDAGYAHARMNLANTLRIMGRPADARDQLETVLNEHPNSSEALNNLGTVLQDLGMAGQARDCLRRALALAPQKPQIRWNLALSQLLLGEYEEGWANYEARWEGCANLIGAYDKPADLAWRGEDLTGKRLLLWAEQGFGDTIQFIRFAERLAQQGATVIAEVQPELRELLSHALGVDTAVARGQPLPPYDWHCPLMSLPHWLGATLDDSLSPDAYLHAAPDKAAYWRQQLAGSPGKKIGLTWAGKSRLQNAELAAVDARRSIRLTQLEPLLQNTHCSFFSLQKGEPAAEAHGTSLPLRDFSAEWQDFADTAAFIANLDLVITVDTAVAHLAGALGKPVWLLNRH
ncbi:MAG: tetratricopeptide repeat protein, partial [Burkholderiaceae bacterium]|nr:tetratricopeptide repeat protein [Burkholderiaceae bacterium]